jgi:hypothetical protein
VNWFGEFEVAAAAVVTLELAFLAWVWLRSRRRGAERSMVADAYRLGLRHRRGRVRLWA